MDIFPYEITLWSSSRVYSGPLLFLIYIDDFPNCLEFTAPCLLVDDTQTFASTIDADDLANNINSDLENCVIASS